MPFTFFFFFFFFNDTATTEIYTLSLHDALPICRAVDERRACVPSRHRPDASRGKTCAGRSEEHTSELQSRRELVCRLLLEKKKKNYKKLTGKNTYMFDTHRLSTGECALTASEKLRFFFFFNDTATTEIYTLSLHDALPIFGKTCAG